MTSNGLHPNKPHHSSLFSVFHRRKRQSATPIAPQSTINLSEIEKKDGQKPPSGPRKQKTKKNNIDLIDGMKTSQSQTLVKDKKKKKKDPLAKGKAFSADCINELDPDYLTEALLAIGDNQPMVARSTPKHAVLRNTEKRMEQRQRKDCLFQPEVYEKMLSDSLAVCDLLTSHLDECISTVRSRSPILERKLMSSPVPGFDSLPYPGSPLPAHSGPYPLNTKSQKDRIPPIR
ncbi:unnamed protein product [Bursaphelenchus xylophilus]|uniref:(pine wood nematode) hypothetical protein n=1 Tax=Bursaphelenchus xylophilus TaxID=6326 RepID=A0A1I7RQW0_BURXY|nr:unnamed protein product [Bursaphelenchus xylophilus]CAG9130705.1 unnamed protein product [Bursaphelenchus xylophilus]